MGERGRGWGWGTAVLLAGLLLSASGCFGHVTLVAPPATAPLKARVKAYNALRPVMVSAELITDNSGTYGPFDQRLHLADGQSIYYPDDLLPVVSPTSACAAAARDYLQAVHVQHTLYLVGLPLVGAGLVAVVAGFLAWQGAVVSGRDPGSLSPVVDVGFAAIGVGAVLAAVGSWIFGPVSRDAAGRAFRAYDAALQARLGVRARVRTVDVSTPVEGR